MIYSEIKIDNELTKDNILKTLYNTRIKYFTIIRSIKKLIKLYFLQHMMLYKIEVL